MATGVITAYEKLLKVKEEKRYLTKKKIMRIYPEDQKKERR
jgi:hypothetical protein